VYVGQLYPWKGTGTLVEAMQYLPAGELHLVGGAKTGFKPSAKRPPDWGWKAESFSMAKSRPGK